VLASSFDQMIQSLLERTRDVQERTQELEEEASKIRAILESIADGVIVEDKEGQIIMMNPAAEKILGSMREDLLTNPVGELLAIRAKGEPPTADSPGDRWFEIGGKMLSASEASVITKDGIELGKVMVFRDITREVEMGEFLDIMDIEDGTLGLSLASVSLDELILEVMDSWQERIGKKQISAIRQWPSDLPQVLADRDRVKRVLHNLISNACNYTMPGGKITVAAYVEGDKVRVDVEDTGVGISEPDQSRLFTRFFRARRVPHDDVLGAGLGLGLYMAKALIEAHGERIWLDRSEPGEGSVFSFTLPIVGEQMSLVALNRVLETLPTLDRKPETLLIVLYTLIQEGAKAEELGFLQGHLEKQGRRVAADIVRSYNLLLSLPEASADHLPDLIKALAEDDALEHSQEVRELYEGCLAALEVKSVARITTFHWSASRPNSFLAPAAQALVDLSAVTEALAKYERVEELRDKIVYLAEALERLDEKERSLERELANPERLILQGIIAHWRTIVTNALREIQGSAQLQMRLVTRQIPSQAPAALVLEVHNIGQSPASNLRAKLMPGSGYRSLEDTVTVDILPVGGQRELRFSVQPVAKDEFRVQFHLAYDDREREDKEEIYGDLVRLFARPEEFVYIPNPYTPGTPLQPGNPLFVGRQDTFEYVRENISGLFRSNILVLIGQRRTGKTSLLKQLPARLASEGYISIYIDGQSLGIDPGMANFFHQLSWEIADALEEEGLEVKPPSLEELGDNPRAVFERDFMAQVEKAIGERQLLLLLDEFETLEERVREGRLDAALFPYLRHLMQERDKLAFIFVGTHKIEEMAADYWSVLFNTALYRPIGFLDEAAAHRLIIEPVREYNMIYDDLAVDKMLRATAGHPYFLQLLCHSLVKIHNSQRCNYITVREVSQALEEIVTAGEAHFIFLWKDAKPNEQLVMAALARVSSGRTPSLTSSLLWLPWPGYWRRRDGPLAAKSSTSWRTMACDLTPVRSQKPCASWQREKSCVR
jgi:signal transduction histidine kinase